MLLGTALSVIIPEGVQTLNMAYSGHNAHHGDEHGGEEHHENPGHHLIGVSLVLGFIFMLVIDQIANSNFGSRDVEVGKNEWNYSNLHKNATPSPRRESDIICYKRTQPSNDCQTGTMKLC